MPSSNGLSLGALLCKGSKFQPSSSDRQARLYLLSLESGFNHFLCIVQGDLANVVENGSGGLSG